MRFLIPLLLLSLFGNAQFAVTRNPTSDDLVTGTWTGTASSRYTVVNDFATDVSGTTTLLLSTAGGGNITFGFSAFALPNNASNIQVMVDYYDQKTASQSSNFGARLKISGTYYNASTHNPATSYTSRRDTWATNPATGAAWTYLDVNNLQAFGVNSTDASPTINLASIIVRVTYDVSNRKVRYLIN